MAQMMEKLPLSDEIKEALLVGQGPLAPFLDAAIAYEKGLTEECVCALDKLRANPEKVYGIYLEAIKFSAIID
jgi:EAL and modified HD-GYP domain-containing signal transduction protein